MEVMAVKHEKSLLIVCGWMTSKNYDSRKGTNETSILQGFDFSLSHFPQLSLSLSHFLDPYQKQSSYLSAYLVTAINYYTHNGRTQFSSFSSSSSAAAAASQ